MTIYKPSLLDKFKDFVNGVKANWDDYETHKADSAPHSNIAGCSVTRSTNLSIAHAIETYIDFDVESYDNDSMHESTNPSRITINTSGKYLVTGQVLFNTNGAGDRRLALVKNRVSVEAETRVLPVTGTQTTVIIIRELELLAGDYIELRARQNSGGALDMLALSYTPHFQARRLT